MSSRCDWLAALEPDSHTCPTIHPLSLKTIRKGPASLEPILQTLPASRFRFAFTLFSCWNSRYASTTGPASPISATLPR